MNTCLLCGFEDEGIDNPIVLDFISTLESGWVMRCLVYCAHSQKFIYTKRYVQELSGEKKTRRKQYELVADMKFIFGYAGGIISEAEINIDLNFPLRKQKEYYVGVDISPEAHYFIEIAYKRSYSCLEVKSIFAGGRELAKVDDIDWKRYDKGVFKSEVPFPVRDKIYQNSDSLIVPYSSDCGKLEQLFVPVSILQRVI